MKSKLKFFVVLIALIFGPWFGTTAFAPLAAAGTQSSLIADRPRIRTITAFVSVDRSKFQDQIASALAMLRAVRGAFTQAGYEVETIRITTQSFPSYTQGLTEKETLAFFQEFDRLAQREAFTPAIGPGKVEGLGQADLLASILATTQSLNGFLTVADESGILWKNVEYAARVQKYLEDHTPFGEGNFRFAAGAFPPPHAPFYPVSLTVGAGMEFTIGLESANIVRRSFASSSAASTSSSGGVQSASERLSADLGLEAAKVEEIAVRLEASTGWKYVGIDLTPVPLKDISIGGALEALLPGPLGRPGSLSAAYAVTSALQRIPVRRAGYNGLMLPILEDDVLARRWEQGNLSRDSLLSFSAVCSMGIDAVPLPGDISQQELQAIIGDVATLGVKWHKPLSARLLPAPGKRAGDRTEFRSPYLVNIRIPKN